MKTIEIRRIDGDVIFSHTCEDNTVKNTLELGVLQRINFDGADLKGKDLRGAKLSFGEFNGANFDSSDLTDAIMDKCECMYTDFTRAVMENITALDTDFTGAIMRYANLLNGYLVGCTCTDAYMSYSILNGTNLRDVNFDGAHF